MTLDTYSCHSPLSHSRSQLATSQYQALHLHSCCAPSLRSAALARHVPQSSLAALLVPCCSRFISAANQKKMVKLMFAGVVSATLLGFSCTVDAWGKKNDDEPAMPKGKEAVELGRAGFRQVAGDVGLLQDLLKDLEDPETLKEVQKLMKDKKFKKEMDALMASDEWKTGADDASKFLSDPAAMEAMKKQTTDYTDFLASGPGKDGRKDASMGLEAAAMGMMDPGFMKEAMEMMNDPAVMKQVEETMKNPDFQKQMRSMMENPTMKAQLAAAGANVEQLMKDPKMMAEAQRQMQAMMGGAAA